MSRLALFLFGPPRMECDGAPVVTDTRKAVALMAYLAVTRQPHSRDAMAALLWPDYDQQHARATLRRTLSDLHKTLAGKWLHIDRETLSLDRLETFWLDVDEFRSHLAAYHAQSPHHLQPGEMCAGCLEHLKQAVTLYSDDFMAGFSLPDSAPFDDWQFYQADELRRELAKALEQLVLYYRTRAEYDAAIPYARRFLALDRLHEPAHRYLMELYAWSGQRAAAIHQYRECVKALEEELGVSPLEATTQLYQTIKENRVTVPLALEQQPSLTIAKAAPAAGSHPYTKEEELYTQVLPSGNYPLVGRQNEWATLLNIYAEKAHAGYVVVLEGEAGIGKTRLAEEFIAYARSQGSRAVTVRCYEGEVDLAYGPIATGLRMAIGQQGPHWHKEIAPHWLCEAARLLPELATLCPGLPPPAALDSLGAQSRFFEGLRHVWFALCANTDPSTPGILCFDDIHWADETSLKFLSYLVRRLNGQPLCLLLTYRNIQRSTIRPLHRLLVDLQRGGKARLFALPRLDQATVEQLVQRVAASGINLSQGLTQHLYQETEGVPLFLTEYLTAMTTGALKAEEDEWSLPGGVYDVLASRLMVIEEASRQLLGTAAAIGRSFDFDILREVSGRSEEETVSGLEELIGQGLVEEMPGSSGSEGRETGSVPAHSSQSGHERALTYDFCHEKVRNLVYNEMSLARRRLLHRRTAEALVARLRGQREAGALTGQIAHHYLAAGNTELAASYFRQAGEYARALYAHTEALAHFSAALELHHPESASLQETIGDLHTFLGEYEAALKSYQAAEALSEAPQTRAILEQKQGRVYERRGSWEQAETHYAAALRHLEQEGATEGQARIYADWSLAAHHRGQVDQARDLAQRALFLAEAVSDAPALAQAHNMLGILANSRGEMEQAHFHLTRSVALAEDLQDVSIRAAALNNLALAYRASGDLAQAIGLTETALALCRSQGDRHREAALHSNLADLLHEAGRTDEAMSQLKTAARIYTDIDVEAGTTRPEIWKLVEW